MVTNEQTTDSGILYVNQTMLQASKILNLCVKDNMWGVNWIIETFFYQVCGYLTLKSENWINSVNTTAACWATVPYKVREQ